MICHFSLRNACLFYDIELQCLTFCMIMQGCKFRCKTIIYTRYHSCIWYTHSKPYISELKLSNPPQSKNRRAFVIQFIQFRFIHTQPKIDEKYIWTFAIFWVLISWEKVFRLNVVCRKYIYLNLGFLSMKGSIRPPFK